MFRTCSPSLLSQLFCIRRRTYYDAAAFYTRQLVAAGVDTFFVTSDDPRVARQFAKHVATVGGRVVNSQLTSTSELGGVPGGEAIVDLFRLAACRAVMLVARYSGFSFIASLLDHPTPVVIFQGLLPAERKWLGVVEIVELRWLNETGRLLQALGVAQSEGKAQAKRRWPGHHH